MLLVSCVSNLKEMVAFETSSQRVKAKNEYRFSYLKKYIEDITWHSYHNIIIWPKTYPFTKEQVIGQREIDTAGGGYNETERERKIRNGR